MQRQKPPMSNTFTSKGQFTIPTQIRDALGMTTGCLLDFAVNAEGALVIHKVGARPNRKRDRCACKQMLLNCFFPVTY